MKLKNPLTWKLQTKDMEKPSKEKSLTVPDDSFTISELLEKHKHGIALNIKRLGNYEPDIEDDSFDAIDMEALQRDDKPEREEKIRSHLAKVQRAQEAKKRHEQQLKQKQLEEEKALIEEGRKAREIAASKKVAKKETDANAHNNIKR